MNTQIETVEDVAKRITDNNGYFGEFATTYESGVITGINWQKQQDEAKYKELLDSHNELLKTLLDLKDKMEYVEWYE